MAMKKACLNYVQSYFGLLISARHIYARYNATVRGHLERFFDMIKAEVKKSIRDSYWIDTIVKDKVHAKLDEISFNAMPDDRFFSKTDLATLYRNFPRIRGSFVENFIAIAKAYRKVIGEDSFITIFSKRLGGGDASRYNYYYNIAFVALGAMEPPILYDDGTLAMRYGSLGMMLAQCMVRSFDIHGVFVNKAGENEAWWGGVGGPAEAAPLRLVGRTGRPDWWPGLAATVGTVPAGERNARCVRCVSNNGDACNVPLRHSAKFATAFRCPPRSRMNPSDKCLFFD
ncbi:hypothetical protein MRX96_038172 [Rhipicephalus microplus]